MFVLQGRRGSEGRQGLAGTPGAAVSIERKNQNQWNFTYSTKSSYSRTKWDMKLFGSPYKSRSAPETTDS